MFGFGKGKHHRTQDQEFPQGKITGKLAKRGTKAEEYKPGRDSKPIIKPETIKNWKAKGEGYKPKGSRQVPRDMM